MLWKTIKILKFFRLQKENLRDKYVFVDLYVPYWSN